ncbi:MAG: polysaccharide deacetylase family protein, partial [Bacteroidota bacterium]
VRAGHTEEPVLYLTFDDGPIPGVTPWVLEQLEKYQAKATFFCVGENVRRNPQLVEDILAAGHSVGNHTMRHLDGWATENLPYFHDIRHCSKQINSSLFVHLTVGSSRARRNFCNATTISLCGTCSVETSTLTSVRKTV